MTNGQDDESKVENHVELSDDEKLEKFVKLTTEAASLYGFNLMIVNNKESDEVKAIVLGEPEAINTIGNAIADLDFKTPVGH